MKRRIFPVVSIVLSLMLLFTVPAFAVPDEAKPAFDRKVTERIEVENVWEHLEVLADEIGVRAAGTSEEREAAEYISKHFDDLGYDARLDEFELLERVIVPEVEVTSPEEFKLFPAPLTKTALAPDEGVEGTVVDWEDSLEPPEEWSEGDIAFMDSPEGATGGYSYDEEVEAALEAEASAVIFNMYDHGKETLFANILGGELDDPVDIPAIIISPMQGEELRSFLETEEEVEVQIVLEVDGTSQNVIATREPSNKNRAEDEVIIIGAHYDSVYGAPGANDNAGSVAILMEIARVIANYPLEREVKFMAFGAEERGFLGAWDYVENLTEEEKDRIAGMINVEMPGSAHEPQDEVFTATVDGHINFMNKAMLDAGARLTEELPESQAVGASDHVPFHNAGITASLFARAYPGSLPWDPEGRFGLEPQYHTPYDTLDQMCIDRLDHSARVLGAALYDLVRAETPALERSEVRN